MTFPCGSKGPRYAVGAMKKIRPYLIGAAMAVAVIVTMWQAREQAAGPRWEYLYVEQQWVKFDPVPNQAGGPRLVRSRLLNDLGAEGWELLQAGVGGYLFRRSVRAGQ